MEENIMSNKKIRFIKILVSIILISILPIYYIYSNYFINSEIISESKLRNINIFDKCTVNISNEWKIKDEIQDKYILIENENVDGYIYCEEYKTKNIFDVVSVNTNENQLNTYGWVKINETNSNKVINLRILKIKEKQYKKADKTLIKATYVYPVDKEFNLVISLQYNDMQKYKDDIKYIINSIESLIIVNKNDNSNTKIGELPVKKSNGNMYVELKKYNAMIGIEYIDEYEKLEGRTPESMSFKYLNPNDKVIANVSLINMDKYEYLRKVIESYEMNSNIDYIKDIDIYTEKTFEQNGNKFSYITIKYIEKQNKKKKESVYVVSEIRPTMLYAIEIINETRNTNIDKIKEFTNIIIDK